MFANLGLVILEYVKKFEKIKNAWTLVKLVKRGWVWRISWFVLVDRKKKEEEDRYILHLRRKETA